MRAMLQRTRSELSTLCHRHEVFNSLLTRCNVARIFCHELSPASHCTRRKLIQTLSRYNAGLATLLRLNCSSSRSKRKRHRTKTPTLLDVFMQQRGALPCPKRMADNVLHCSNTDVVNTSVTYTMSDALKSARKQATSQTAKPTMNYQNIATATS